MKHWSIVIFSDLFRPGLFPTKFPDVGKLKHIISLYGAARGATTQKFIIWPLKQVFVIIS